MFLRLCYYCTVIPTIQTSDKGVIKKSGVDTTCFQRQWIIQNSVPLWLLCTFLTWHIFICFFMTFLLVVLKAFCHLVQTAWGYKLKLVDLQISSDEISGNDFQPSKCVQQPFWYDSILSANVSSFLVKGMMETTDNPVLTIKNYAISTYYRICCLLMGFGDAKYSHLAKTKQILVWSVPGCKWSLGSSVHVTYNSITRKVEKKFAILCMRGIGPVKLNGTYLWVDVQRIGL